MRLIKESEQTADCLACRHYGFFPEEILSHVCRAMEYAGKRPAADTMFHPEEGPCPLFESSGKVTP
jgi:hypothetical protein